MTTFHSAEQSVDFPSLKGHRVNLRPLAPPDYEWLYVLSSLPEVSSRWRFRGSTPSPEVFRAALWSNCDVQLIVEAADGSGPLGLLQLVDRDDRSGYAGVNMILRPDFMRRGWPFEGIAIFVEYVFRCWALRKLYFHTVSFNATQFQSAIGTLLTEEGRLRDHEYHDGKYFDLLILALYRETWQEARRTEIGEMLFAAPAGAPIREA